MKRSILIIIIILFGACSNVPKDTPENTDDINGPVTDPGIPSTADSTQHSHDTTTWEGATNDTGGR